MMIKSKRKAMGQHFLTHKKTLDRIIRVIAPKADDFIIEIGAGKGALTLPLAKTGAHVIAIEKDRSLILHLQKHIYAQLTILEKDVLAVDFKTLVKKKKAKIVGNLPYAISSPLLFKVLRDKDLFTLCVFLLQKEVALRLCAKPGTKNYAPLSLLFQNDFFTKVHFLVPASSFNPQPRVESALVSLEKRRQPLFLTPHQEQFQKFLKRAFQNRRKKLLNNLKIQGIPPSTVRDAYLHCGVDEKMRPEQVSLSQFVALYEFLSRIPLEKEKGS